MGAVYAGRHRNGAVAAIKLLHPELARNKVLRERFLREGYAANKVGHAGVVKVQDDDVVSSGPDEGTAYLVMELLDGESLQDRIERGQPIGERDFLEIADSVLDVLQAAHKNGVVHRDLKPENLFISREDGGRVKVLDFGLARLLEEQTITAYGLVLGTPSFMSPEQAAGKTPEIDGRTDQFALAATGFRLRSGRRIHEGEDAIELVRKMSTLAAPPLRSVAPDASEPFARVIDRALQFKREDRYESAAAMQADVRRALKELEAAPSRATGQRSPDRSDLEETRKREAPPAPAPPPPPPPPKGRAAKAKGKAKARAERTIEISERDLVRPSYGMDESVRIPKRRSILPWLVLLLLGAAGAKAYLYYHPLGGDPNANDAPSSGPDAAASATPDASAHSALDAGSRPRGAGSTHGPLPPKPPKLGSSLAH
jgi:serine/threonine-protein kinase